MSLESRDGKGRTLLMAACAAGHVGILGTLLRAGCSVEATTQAGKTALAMAISGGHLEAVRTMLKHAPALLQRTDAAGTTPLMLAAEVAEVNKNGPAVVELLLGEGADAKAQDAKGLTALDRLCATTGNIKAARALLSFGAEIRNDIDKRHTMTTLMHASLNGHRKLVVELIEKWGSDPRVVNEAGGTARSFAETAGHIAVVHLLDGYLGKMNAATASSSSGGTGARK